MRSLVGWARTYMDRRRLDADLKWRRPPKLEVGPASGNPTVYYLVPHLSEPAGGVRVMYRHVDLLNEMGIRAAVLHDSDGFRAGWFANDTRIVYPAGLVLSEDDILVVPECYGPGLDLLPAPVRKIVFNQAAYHTFDLMPIGVNPYADVPSLLGMMTVSKDNLEMLRFCFPGMAIWGTRPVIDAKIFHRGPQPLQRRLAFMPDRREAERHQLLHMLAARRVLAGGPGQGVGWDLVPISGHTEAEVGQIMRECAIFLSFSDREGFGLPPAEAMASGCYVIGYDGGGGREFFDPAYSCPVTDQTSFAKAVVEATARPLEELQSLGAKASEQVLAMYTLDGLRADLRAVYEKLV